MDLVRGLQQESCLNRLFSSTNPYKVARLSILKHFQHSIQTTCKCDMIITKIWVLHTKQRKEKWTSAFCPSEYEPIYAIMFKSSLSLEYCSIPIIYIALKQWSPSRAKWIFSISTCLSSRYKTCVQNNCGSHICHTFFNKMEYPRRDCSLRGQWVH